MTSYWPNYSLSSPNDWPPTNPAPSNDSIWGLKYAFTQTRLDSLRRYISREYNDTARAKGRRHISGSCF